MNRVAIRNKPGCQLRVVALAAVAASCISAATAAVTTTGQVATYPGLFTLGPGDTTIDTGVFVGNSAFGRLDVNGGSRLRARAISSADSASGNGIVVIDGTNTRVELVGDGFSDGILARFQVGAWGVGSTTVSGGAVLDAAAQAANCLGVGHVCDTNIGNGAGSDATFTVTGAGSQALFLRGFYVGRTAAFGPPGDGFLLGTPGGTTQARVNVLDGALLRTDFTNIGNPPAGSLATGNERSLNTVLISGAQSRWDVTGGTIDIRAASFSTSLHRNAWTALDVVAGGTLAIGGSGDVSNFVNLTSGGGRTDARVDGAGSNISFSAQSSVLNVGRSLGSATLELRNGGQLNNVWYMSVGRDASFGTMTVDGTGSIAHVDGSATAAANSGATGTAVFDIGRGGGTGLVNVVNGGRIEVLATTATTQGTALSIGRDAASSGTLNIGSGGTVLVRASSVAPGTSGEAFNPFVRIGRDGSGTLSVTGGGKLLIEGNAVSAVANTRRTNLFIGGAGDTISGGRGNAVISGVGSEVRVSGSDAYIGVGHGPLASGNLTLADQAKASAIILGIGNFGGTGVARLTDSRIDLTGQYTGSGEFGASLAVGAGAGAVGNLMLINSVVRIDNAAGSNSGGVTIGGSLAVAGGDGSVNLSAGSSIQVIMQPGAGGFTVGRTGSGVLRLSDASSVDVGNGSFFVGRNSGSDGTLIATGGSTITAGFVGVGRNTVAGGGTIDGGTATVVLNGATLNAQNVVIGTNGYLGGSAGSINVSGSVVNYGIFSPGSSPGRFDISGDFSAAAGSRLILEVERRDGAFVIDDLRFAAGHLVTLGGSAIEFRFLGDTDPNAFFLSGAFDIASFVRQADGTGALAGLDASAYAGATFSARADAYLFTSFEYTLAGGASFIAVPNPVVPEPATWLLFAAGLSTMVAAARRSRRS